MPPIRRRPVRCRFALALPALALAACQGDCSPFVARGRPGGGGPAGGGGPPRAVAEAAGRSTGLAADGGAVFWLEGEAVRAQQGADAPRTVARCAATARLLALTAQHAYWTAGSTLRRAPRGGGAATSVGPSPERPTCLIAGPEAILWGTASGAIYAFVVGRGAVRRVADGAGQPPVSLALAGGQVFWQTAFSIRRAPTAGGAAEELLQLSPTWGRFIGLAAARDRLYFVRARRQHHAPAGQLQHIDQDGGRPETLSSAVAWGPHTPTTNPLAADEAHVYWANGDGSVMCQRLAGGAPTALTQALGPVSLLAQDQAAIYVVSTPRGQAGSRLTLIPKPGG